MNSRKLNNPKVRAPLMQWALERVPEADTVKMLALLGLRNRGLDLNGFPRLPVQVYRDIVRRGADHGVDEDEVAAWLRVALEMRVIRGAN